MRWAKLFVFHIFQFCHIFNSTTVEQSHQTKRKCRNELEYLNISFTNSLSSKRLERMLFSGTALSTSRFISSSVTKANRSPILTLIFIVNLTHLEVFEIGEYHRIFPSFSWSIFCHVGRLDNRARAKIFDGL